MSALMAGEVVRRINHPDNVEHLRVRPEKPAYVDRLDSLIWDNFRDVMTPAGVSALIKDRGQEFRNLSDHQVVSSVAASMRSGVMAGRYGSVSGLPGSESGGQDVLPGVLPVGPG